MNETSVANALYVLYYKGQAVLSGYGDSLQIFSSRKSAVSFVKECVDLYDYSEKDYKIAGYKYIEDEKAGK